LIGVDTPLTTTLAVYVSLTLSVPAPTAPMLIKGTGTLTLASAGPMFSAKPAPLAARVFLNWNWNAIFDVQEPVLSTSIS
jgi:hypothetical protein